MITFPKAFALQTGWAALACVALAACGPSTPEASSAAAAPAAAAPAATAAPAVPAHALITLPVGATAPVDYTAQVAAWKASGQVTNALVLQQFDGPEPAGFSAMTVLDFPSETAYDGWKASAAANLGNDLIVRRVDVLTHSETTPRDSDQAIFVVSQYVSLVSPEAYQTYTDDYIVPNMANQKFSGIMTRYTMYLEREASGEQTNPKAVLVTEYANQAEFDRKSAVKGSYKTVLLENHPKWAQINSVKGEIRVDLNETLAKKVAY